MCERGGVPGAARARCRLRRRRGCCRRPPISEVPPPLRPPIATAAATARSPISSSFRCNGLAFSPVDRSPYQSRQAWSGRLRVRPSGVMLFRREWSSRQEPERPGSEVIEIGGGAVERRSRVDGVGGAVSPVCCRPIVGRARYQPPRGRAGVAPTNRARQIDAKAARNRLQNKTNIIRTRVLHHPAPSHPFLVFPSESFSFSRLAGLVSFLSNSHFSCMSIIIRTEDKQARVSTCVLVLLLECQVQRCRPLAGTAGESAPNDYPPRGADAVVFTPPGVHSFIAVPLSSSSHFFLCVRLSPRRRPPPRRRSRLADRPPSATDTEPASPYHAATHDTRAAQHSEGADHQCCASPGPPVSWGVGRDEQ